MEDALFLRLKDAAENNDLTFLKTIIQNGGGAQIRDRFVVQLAQIATIRGHVDILRCLEEVDPSVLVRADTDGETVAHIAAKTGQLEVLSYVAAKDSQFWARKNSNGDTVAFVAVKNGHPEILRFVAKRNSSALAIRDARKNTVLHVLAEQVDDAKKMVKTLKFIVRENATSLMETNGSGETIMHVASKHNNMDILKYAAKTEPSLLSQKNRRGETVAHVAAKHGYMDSVLRYIADTNATALFIPTRQNESYIDLAMEKEQADKQSLKDLTDGKDVASTEVALSVAQLAARIGDFKAIFNVVEKNPSVLEGKNGVAVARVAARCGKVYALLQLIENIPAIVFNNVNILFELPEEQDVMKMIDYIERMCSTDTEEVCKTQTPEGWNSHTFFTSIVHAAVQNGYLMLLKRLLEREMVDINAMRESPIFTAARFQQLDALKCLVERGNADLTALNRESSNILYTCAEENDLTTMKYVLDERKAPIDMDWRNKYEDTVLHATVKTALICNEMEVLEYLVEQKHADVNALGSKNKTALQLAASHSNYGIFNYLLSHGADPNNLVEENERDFWQTMRSNSSDVQLRSRRGVSSSSEPACIHHIRSQLRYPSGLMLATGGESTSAIDTYPSLLNSLLTMTKLVFKNARRPFTLTNTSLDTVDPIAVESVNTSDFA